MARHRVLVVGAGGLGCETLRALQPLDLELHCIDFDLVEESNLARQLLYTMDDVGEPKAKVAAGRVPGLHYVVGALEDQPDAYFAQFDAIFGCVDTVRARRNLNVVLCRLPNAPLWIDCGSEGFRGQVAVILGGSPPCFECLLGLYQPDELSLPFCSIPSRPRNKGQCLLWAASTMPTANIHSRPDLQRILDAANAKIAQLALEPLSLGEAMQLLGSQVAADQPTNAAVAAEAVRCMLSRLGEERPSCLAGGANFVTLNTSTGYREEHGLLRDASCPVCSRT